MHSWLGLVLVPALVAAGCSEASPPLVAPAADEPFVACGRVVSPEPSLAPSVEAAAARWSAATGCVVRVGAGGVPIALVHQVVNDEGGTADGVTYIESCEARRIDISATARFPYAVALHEMGHALALSRPCDLATGHTATGIMKAVFSEAVIDAASLELVCAGLDCQRFNAEVPRHGGMVTLSTRQRD